MLLPVMSKKITKTRHISYTKAGKKLAVEPQEPEVDRWWGVRAALRGPSIIILKEQRQKTSVGL